MKKTRLFFAACALLSATASMAQATLKTIQANFGFEQCTAFEGAKTTGSAESYAAEGWTFQEANIPQSCGAVMEYGKEGNLINGAAIALTDNAGNAGKALGISAGWSQTVAYQSETVTLPAGEYTLIAYVYNAGTAANLTSKLGFVPTEGEAILSAVTSFAVGEWSVDYVTFTLAADTEGKIQVGGAAGNSTSSNHAKVFIDNLAFTDAAGLAAAQEAAKQATDAEKAAQAAAAIAKNTAKVEGASISNPVVTDFVVNGTFDSNANGWTSTGAFQNKGTATNQTGAFTGPFWENWNGDALANKMYQNVENIPNGIYLLKIAAFVNNLANPNESQYVFANNDKVYLTTGEPTLYEVYTEVTNNTVSVGLEQTTETANWMGIDNVSLTYFGAEGTIDQAKNAALLMEAANLKDAHTSAAAKTALTEALDAFNANSSEANLTALKEAIAKAQESAKSYAILDNGGLLPDNSLAGWTCTNSNTFHINTWSTEGNSDGTGMKTPFIENWVYRDDVLGTGEIYYSLPGLDPGIYQFSALIRAYSESGNLPTGASLFAGDREKEFATGKSFEYNNMKGIYDIYAMTAQVGDDGVFRFGIKIKEDRNFNWMAFKTCKIEYVGAAITAESIAELAAQIPDEPMNAEVKAAAEAAKATAEQNVDLDSYEALLVAVAAAQSSANAYKVAKTSLDAMQNILDGTNVYTAAAYESYKGVYDEKLAAYEACTLTDGDATGIENPEAVTGWHAATIVDNFLLSAWDTNPDFNDAPYYINTWSTEATDGDVKFNVPFFEYWTGSGYLAARTMTATIEGLEKGIYDVTALIRIQQKEDATPQGVSLQANDGEAVACTGKVVNADQHLYMDSYTAQGEVGEDGKLLIKVVVAEDNNAAWVAFKNVKYEYNQLATGIQTVETKSVKNEAIYNIAGQRVKNAQKGLYIVNGKKVMF